eukprot:TRINITY_DN2818_c0_g1_i2.p1 TRINITY_DN2818_c0_g1~~TRINITY_DN2818_c0_g1_i2.p1  ORF type:complete len:327 (+),score=41.55 TRINITY_DN2818_c0_g1_i2:152-1132(+)
MFSKLQPEINKEKTEKRDQRILKVLKKKEVIDIQSHDQKIYLTVKRELETRLKSLAIQKKEADHKLRVWQKDWLVIVKFLGWISDNARYFWEQRFEKLRIKVLFRQVMRVERIYRQINTPEVRRRKIQANISCSVQLAAGLIVKRRLKLASRVIYRVLTRRKHIQFFEHKVDHYMKLSMSLTTCLNGLVKILQRNIRYFLAYTNSLVILVDIYWEQYLPFFLQDIKKDFKKQEAEVLCDCFINISKEKKSEKIRQYIKESRMSEHERQINEKWTEYEGAISKKEQKNNQIDALKKLARRGSQRITKIPSSTPVSYTHLTLPTIYSV